MFQVEVAFWKLSIILLTQMFSYCTFWVIVCERYSNLFFLFVLLFMLILHSASFSLSVLLSVVETIAPSPAAARVMFCVSSSWG